jgi:nucleoside-diphosphate-sugar epimerase
MRVYLTGGTGLLGSHLALRLRARDHEVVALCRENADTLLLNEHGCEIVHGDVRDGSASLTSGMADCTHLVHGAALVYADGHWPTVRAVNVDGTENVLRAGARAGVRCAVHLSSVAVYGTVDGEVNETASIERAIPEDDLYARSKREAELVARRVEAEEGLILAILRPSAVYGERDRLMIPAVADIVDRRLVPMFGSGENTLPIVYAGNVAEAIRLVLEAGEGGVTYDVGRDETLTQRQLFQWLAAGLGRQPSFVRIPAGVVRGAVALLSTLGVGTPGAKHLPLERVARLALGENPYPSLEIRRKLGWSPSETHQEALKRSGEWFVANS